MMPLNSSLGNRARHYLLKKNRLSKMNKSQIAVLKYLVIFALSSLLLYFFLRQGLPLLLGPE